MEAVVNNIIHDLQIVNRKADAAFWGLRNFVEFSGRKEEFDSFLKDIKEKAEKEQNEGTKSDKTSTKADSSESPKGK